MTRHQAVAASLSTAAWRKSSRTQNNGQCVELADLTDQIAVRDSKDPHGPALMFAPKSFATFLAKAKRGELEL